MLGGPSSRCNVAPVGYDYLPTNGEDRQFVRLCVRSLIIRWNSDTSINLFPMTCFGGSIFISGRCVEVSRIPINRVRFIFLRYIRVITSGCFVFLQGSFFSGRHFIRIGAWPSPLSSNMGQVTFVFPSFLSLLIVGISESSFSFKCVDFRRNAMVRQTGARAWTIAPLNNFRRSTYNDSFTCANLNRSTRERTRSLRGKL